MTLAYCTIVADLAELVAAVSGPPTTGVLSGQVTIVSDAPVLGIPGVGIRRNGPYPVAVVSGAVSVEVPATGQDGVTSPADFTYTARFALLDAAGRAVAIRPLTFQAPAGTTVDLASVPQVAPSGGTFVGVTADEVSAMITALGLGSAATHPAADFATAAALATLASSLPGVYVPRSAIAQAASGDYYLTLGS